MIVLRLGHEINEKGDTMCQFERILTCATVLFQFSISESDRNKHSYGREQLKIARTRWNKQGWVDKGFGV